MNLMVPVAEFTQGAIIYYRVGKKKKQLVVESFEQLETINAPQVVQVKTNAGGMFIGVKFKSTFLNIFFNRLQAFKEY